MSGRYYER